MPVQVDQTDTHFDWFYFNQANGAEICLCWVYFRHLQLRWGGGGGGSKSNRVSAMNLKSTSRVTPPHRMFNMSSRVNSCCLQIEGLCIGLIWTEVVAKLLDCRPTNLDVIGSNPAGFFIRFPLQLSCIISLGILKQVPQDGEVLLVMWTLKNSLWCSRGFNKHRICNKY